MSAGGALPAILTGLLCLGSGYGIARLLGARRSGPEAFGLAFALGSAWLALAAAALGALGPFVRGPTLLGALALPWALARPWRARQRTAEPPRRAEPRHGARSAWLGFLPAILVALVSFWLAAQRPVWNIDAQKRWVLHAQWIALDHTALPERVRDPAWSSSHPTYPPLVPAAVALALELGADPDTGVRPLFPFFFLALCAVIHGHAHRARGAWSAALVTTAFALTPCFAYQDRRGDAIGLAADAAMADVPLALLCGALWIELLALVSDRGRARGGVAGLLAAGAVLTKQEGVALVAASLAAALAVSALSERGEVRRARLSALAIASASAVFAALGWRMLASGMPIEPGEDYLGPATLLALPGGLDRLPAILARLAGELADVRTFGLLWLVALASLAHACWRALRARAGAGDLLPAVWLLLGLLATIAGYLVTGWKGGYPFLMEVSLTRLLMHLAPLAAIQAASLLPRDGPGDRPGDRIGGSGGSRAGAGSETG